MKSAKEWLSKIRIVKSYDAWIRDIQRDALESAARLAEMDLGCTCACPDIGVGIMHEPGCGLPNPVELAHAIRALVPPEDQR